MSTEKQLSRIRRISMQYKYADGFVEMSLGIIFVITSILLLTIFALDNDYAWLITVGAVISIFAIAFVLGRVVNNLKENITYPRTGYVEIDNPEEKRFIFIRLAMAVALIGVAWLLKDTPNSIALFNGLVMAIVTGLIGVQYGVRRLYGIAALAIVFGIVFTWSGFSTDISYTGPYAGTGLALIVSGALTLSKYLQNNQSED